MARLLILSDLHLGRPRCAARGAAPLRPLWEGADRVVINGDVAEVHHPNHWSAAARETLCLYDLCERDGVELTLLSGNHDPYLSDIRHLHVAGGRIFVTHGDVLHPAVAPWSLAAPRIREAHAAAIAALAPEARDHLESRLSASQHASFAEWSEAARLEHEAAQSSVRGMLMRPWALAKVLYYWRIIPGLAARFAEKHAPDARFVVMGHTHRPGHWTFGDRVILNTGSFGFPGRPRAVVVEDGVLSFLRIVHDRATYRLDPNAIAEFEIPPAPARPEESTTPVEAHVELP